MIAILIALDPEADALAFQSSLVNFNRQNVFQKHKLIYKDARALENMGQANCLVIDLSTWIKDTFE
jgi:hypothetical protein